jgi:hypothetical protein
MIELKIATLDDTAEPNDVRTHGNLSFMGAHIHFRLLERASVISHDEG